MKTGKRILSTFAMIFLFGSVGYFIGKTGWIDSIAPHFQSGGDLRFFLSIILSYFVSILLHESGHLVLGLSSGYRFLSFRILSFALERQANGSLRIRRRRVPGTLGQCLMTPSETKRLSVFWYNFGGVFFNLVGLAVSIAALRQSSTIQEKMWWAAMILLSALFSIVNWFPFHGVQNDGNIYREIKQNPVSREVFEAVLWLSQDTLFDRNVTELDLRTDPKRLSYEQPLQASHKTLFLMKALYDLRFPDFAALIQEALVFYKARKDPKANAMKVLFYFNRLLTEGTSAVASKDKATANLLKVMRRDPVVQLIVLFEARLTNHPKTETFKARFLQTCRKASYQGEAKDLLRLARHLEEAVSNNHLPLVEAELPSAVSIPNLDIAVSDGESKNPD